MHEFHLSHTVNLWITSLRWLLKGETGNTPRLPNFITSMNMEVWTVNQTHCTDLVSVFFATSPVLLVIRWWGNSAPWILCWTEYCRVTSHSLEMHVLLSSHIYVCIDYLPLVYGNVTSRVSNLSYILTLCSVLMFLYSHINRALLCFPCPTKLHAVVTSPSVQLSLPTARSCDSPSDKQNGVFQIECFFFGSSHTYINFKMQRLNYDIIKA